MKRDLRVRILILVLGVLLQVVLFAAQQTAGWRLIGDELRYHDDAVRLLVGDARPPNFVWPPMQEWILAGLYAIFGPGRGPLWILQTAMLVASGLLLERLVLRAGLPPAAGLAALAYLLLDPGTAAFAAYLWPEIPHLFFLLSAVALLVLPAPSPRSALAAGLALGLALLTRSLLLPLVPFFALSTGQLRRGGALLLGVGLVTVPLVAWNGLRWGTWGIAQSGPFNLWVGLSDPPGTTDYDTYVAAQLEEYRASSPVPSLRNAVALRKSYELVRARGPLGVLRDQLGKQPRRLLSKESYLTDRLPGGRFEPGRSARLVDFLLRGLSYLAYSGLLLLGAIGLSTFPWRERLASGLLPLAFLAFNLGLLLILHVKTRYRLAFVPSLIFFSVGLSRRDAFRPNRWIAIAGTLLGALGLWIAWS